MIPAIVALFAILGLPLFCVIAALALYAFSQINVDLSVIIIEMSRLTDTPMLLSLPLFIFTGTLLSESNAPQRLLELTKRFLGWLPGGLALVTLAICSIFTAFTGASGITIIALGGLLYPALKEDRYSEPFTLGLLTTAGSLGLLFPPSLPLILFGVVAETPVDSLFRAGIIPGLVMVIILGAYAIIRGPKKTANIWKQGKRPALQKEMLWEVPLPILILGGIYGGILVVGEAAAVAAVYSILVEVFVLRDVAWQRLPAIAVRSMSIFGGILVVLAASMATTNFLIDQQVPNLLFKTISSLITSKYTFLLLLNVFLLVVGAMLDIFSALVLVVPLIVPIALSYGVDLVHLGIIFLTNLQIGYCTPPVGLNLFLASYRFDRPIPLLYRACLPFLLLLMGCLLLITFIPDLSLLLL
jgi:C4-dicarboxylate transporter DctM subunit